MSAIRSIHTIALASRGRGTHGIMVAVDMTARDDIPSLVPELVETIKLQRMLSPVDTSVLLITVEGPFDAEVFRESWNRSMSSDAALASLMKGMAVASFVHGRTTGKVLVGGSLVSP